MERSPYSAWKMKRIQSADFDRSLQTGSRSLQTSRSADLLQQFESSRVAKKLELKVHSCEFHTFLQVNLKRFNVRKDLPRKLDMGLKSEIDVFVLQSSRDYGRDRILFHSLSSNFHSSTEDTKALLIADG